MTTPSATRLFKVPKYIPQLLDIAAHYGTPTYVYSEDIIRRQCNLLKTHLKNAPTRLLYAMKANSHPAILQIIRSEGFGIDAVSPAELHLARRVGFAPEDILYTANNMTDEEMHEVVAQGVLLNLGELSRLERFGEAYPGSRVCVRLNPQIGSGHHEHVVTAGKSTKFGIPVQERNQILEVAARYKLKIAGIHQHIGSGIRSINELNDAMAVLLDTAQYFPDLEFVNMGGGFSIPYRPDEKPIDFENFESTLVETLLNNPARKAKPDLTFSFEPGRFLVAESGTLLVTANTLKEANDKRFAGTDSGMNQLVRPTVYGAYHEIYNLSNPTGHYLTYDVVGNICESGDVFARDRSVQEIREGDTLAIMDAGAYGMSMASVYNLRPMPAEVLLRSDGTFKCISKRLSVKDLLEQTYGDYWAF